MTWRCGSTPTTTGGGWNGRVAAWDEAGKQKFFGEYKLNRLDGVSCLFENGDLSAVAEYEHGGVQAVHRIAAGKIQESFNDPKQAGALIREIAAEELNSQRRSRQCPQPDARLR